MIVLVADTSVLIDLEHGGLLQVAFVSGLTLVVPDLLYDYELAERNGNYLQSLGLVVVDLTPTELAVAQELKNSRVGLSLPDCFALACAQRAGHALATGDQNLRKAAVERGVEVHGVLWLLDLLADAGVPRETLAQGLMAIRDHPKCQLPKGEMESRIDAWTR
jgi:predicted nucleic acid-binding protein